MKDREPFETIPLPTMSSRHGSYDPPRHAEKAARQRVILPAPGSASGGGARLTSEQAMVILDSIYGIFRRALALPAASTATSVVCHFGIAKGTGANAHPSYHCFCI